MNQKNKTNINKPILYLISTPIGNLQEFSPRAIAIIKNMDFIAAEDTRISGNLLNLFKIKKKFISCHKYNEHQSSKKIVALLKKKYQIAYMCDAGTPCISDPGQILIQECINNEIDVSVINNSNAAISAIVASGLNCEHFYFHGFLNSKEEKRKKELEKLKFKNETIIFYEAPHRINKTLANILEIFGNRKICIAHEISKKYEKYERGFLKEIILKMDKKNKGEFVIVVDGFKEKNTIPEEKLEKIKKMISFFKSKNINSKDTIKKISDFFEIPKNKIYQIYQNLK